MIVTAHNTSEFLCAHMWLHNKQFEQLTASLIKRRRMPNLTKLATGEIPNRRGQKCGRAPALRKASVPIENRYEMTVPTYSSAPPASLSFQTAVNTSIADALSLNASIVK